MKEVILLIGECEAAKSALLSSLEEAGFFTEKIKSDSSLINIIKNQGKDRLVFSLPLKGAKEQILSCKEDANISLTSILLSGAKKCFVSSYRSNEVLPLMERTYPFVDTYIDIGGLSKEALKKIVVDHLILQKEKGPLIVFSSFGYKHGLPSDANFVFDCRGLPNPFWVPELRPLNGLDQPVIDFLSKQEEVNAFLQETEAYLDTQIKAVKQKKQICLMVYFGCTGGQHRSVYLTEKMAERYASTHQVVALHRDLGKESSYER